MDNGYFQCFPVTEHLNGGTCRFGCYEGFDLDGGPAHAYCKHTGQWSDPQPTCKRKLPYHILMSVKLTSLHLVL
jgi:hypothetical protein